MVLFFFVVELEIKQEDVEDALVSCAGPHCPLLRQLAGCRPRLHLPSDQSDGGSSPGWGVAVATDIAFALGVVALLVSCVLAALKVFLLVLAIVDDIGAVLEIAASTRTICPFSALGCHRCPYLNAPPNESGPRAGLLSSFQRAFEPAEQALITPQKGHPLPRRRDGAEGADRASWRAEHAYSPF